MKYIYSKISLDVQNIASQLTVAVKRGDTTRGLIISLTDNGKVYNIPDNCYAVFSARKSDGTYVGDGCTIKDNKIIYDFSDQLAIISGRVDCDITLYDSKSQQLVSPLFTIFVYETIKSEYASEVVSSDEFAMLTKLIQETNETLDEAETVIEEANGVIKTANDTIDNITTRTDEAIENTQEAAEAARASIHHIRNTEDGRLELLDAKGDLIITVDVFCGDDDTLYRYADGVLSVVGIKERNKDNTFRMWVGTNEEYLALKEKDENTFYWITDDMTYDDVVKSISNLYESFTELETALQDGSFEVGKAGHAAKSDNLTALASPDGWQDYTKNETLRGGAFIIKLVDTSGTPTFVFLDTCGCINVFSTVTGDTKNNNNFRRVKASHVNTTNDGIMYYKFAIQDISTSDGDIWGAIDGALCYKRLRTD